jgi:hypothetical protein
MRNLDPAQTLLIQAIKKPLPFRTKGWSYRSKENPGGNIFVTDKADQIIALMSKTQRKVIVFDDWNLMMTNEFMRRSSEHGFQKFSDIGKSAWDVMMAASVLPDDVRVYFLGHVATDEFGNIRARTIGKMLDEKCPVESLFTIVIRAALINGRHIFSTQNSGSDTCKSPIDMFAEQHIDNDLAAVDAAIADFYGITQLATA